MERSRDVSDVLNTGPEVLLEVAAARVAAERAGRDTSPPGWPLLALRQLPGEPRPGAFIDFTASLSFTPLPIVHARFAGGWLGKSKFGVLRRVAFLSPTGER